MPFLTATLVTSPPVALSVAIAIVEASDGAAGLLRLTICSPVLDVTNSCLLAAS